MATTLVLVCVVLFLVTLLWANPSATARQAPAAGSIWIPDGIHTYHTNALDPDVCLWEMEVKPSGFSAGEPIPQDSMWNTRYKMKRAQQLIEGTPSTIKFKYDPNLKSLLPGLVGVETTLTETFYDGSQAAYYGYWKDLEFDALVPGQMGTGTITVQPTNFDKTNRVEAGPFFTNVAGS